MSSLLLAIRRQAKELIETGKTSAEVSVMLGIKPGTVKARNLGVDGADGDDPQPRQDDGNSHLSSCKTYFSQSLISTAVKAASKNSLIVWSLPVAIT